MHKLLIVGKGHHSEEHAIGSSATVSIRRGREVLSEANLGSPVGAVISFSRYWGARSGGPNRCKPCGSY